MKSRRRPVFLDGARGNEPLKTGSVRFRCLVTGGRVAWANLFARAFRGEDTGRLRLPMPPKAIPATHRWPQGELPSSSAIGVTAKRWCAASCRCC